MFIVVIHLLIGFLVSLFLIMRRKPTAYIELKDDKVTSNGDVDSSYMKSQQQASSASESIKRYIFCLKH